ncbi:MAG: MATE family efflux transporter, partial [Firmicutes bacterium]|nr:MATE family efflux transporter [Bacillota bacterium]
MEGKVSKAYTFTSGPLFGPLIKFAMPVLGALILQSLYGAVDLWVVGQYGVKADISAVSTGAQFIMMITNVIIGLAVGTSVLIGQNIGAGRRDLAGDILAAGIKLFAVCALLVMIIIPIAAPAICGILNSPEEAFPKAVSYMRICGLGGIFIVSYNLLSSLFKGMGDSKTPLMAVSIAAVLNIGGDIAFVKGLGMGASGAALATVISQGISVLICIFIIRKRGLPFEFSVDKLKSRQMHNIKRSVRLGAPIALQSLLVNISFLVLTSIINDIGLTESSGLGVAEKLCAFIMLLPSAFAQSMSAVVSQNIGAGRKDRANRALRMGIASALTISVFVGYLAFFHGQLLAGIFTHDASVKAAAADYLKAYAIDCLFTSFLFNFIGYFNGCGYTLFTMLQGIIGAFCVRIPVSLLMKSIQPVSLFRIGLATPCATLVQILFCIIALIVKNRKSRDP